MGVEKAHIIGFKRSGRSAATLLRKLGWKVIISDDKDTEEYRKAAEEFRQMGVQVILGGHGKALEQSVDLVILSPGVPLYLDFVRSRAAQGVEIIGELELGYFHTKGIISSTTGSNGKSTVTSLIGEIFRQTGRPAFTCGNIGLPICDIALQTTDNSLVSVEVSSFQLVSTRKFHPKVSVYLNITGDHAKWHDGQENYQDAKALNWQNQMEDDFAVYNADDPVVSEQVLSARAKKIPFSIEQELDEGAFLRADEMIYRNDEGVEFSIPLSAMTISGRHNIANTLAAIAASYCTGVSPEEIERGISAFKGLAHRLEYVRTLNGVDYINDSKATNVDSGKCALMAMDKPVILIAGGRGKGESYAGLRDLIAERVKKLILIGECAEAIAADVKGATTIEFADSFERSITMAKGSAIAGDVVLLSSLAASYDMFNDFEHRGDEFKRIVMGLK